MKLALFLIVSACVQGTIAFSAELETGAYVSQVSGVTSKVMDLENLMRPVSNLASNLPTMAVGHANYSFVFQNGDFNSAAIFQSGSHNAAFVAQTGFQNAAYLQQFGSGHQSSIIQNGIGNIASTTQH